jgi:hypothetical protein
VHGGDESRYANCLANVLRQLDMTERRGGANGPGSPWLRTKLFDQKECPMEFQDYDFIRNPVAQNQVFFLESKCALCGFPILARSIEELIEHEKLHRTQCTRADVAA